MGFGIATSLLNAGHDVYGADINPDAVRRLQEQGANDLDAGSAVSEIEALVVVVLKASQVEEVLFGEKGFAAGAVMNDMEA